MTREQAEAEARRLGEEHPERDRYQFLTRQRRGDWEVVRVPLPARAGPVKTSTEAKPKPPQPDDPRTSFDRNVGGPYLG